jgi:hypothetical protein
MGPKPDLTGVSDVNLLGNGKGIVCLDTQIPNGALDLPMTEKQLHRSQITRAAVDQRRFGSAKRVRAKDAWVQTPIPAEHIVWLSCSAQDPADR